MFHSARPHSGESARRLSTWASRVRLPWLSRLAALFAVGIALVGLGVDRAARHESEQHLRSDLENSLASYEAILATWAQGLEAVVAEAAREPSLTAEVRDLERLRDQPDALRASSALARLSSRSSTREGGASPRATTSTSAPRSTTSSPIGCTRRSRAPSPSHLRSS